jgi:hypothetical protein
MQKISSYLYPNRINVVADVTLFSTRWNIVYQNKIKIYKGVDNVITVDVKNADQKRIDISDMTLKLSVMDVQGKHFYTADLTATAVTGLATVNIPESALTSIDPQFLSYAIYRLNEDDTKTVFYTDSQFGAIGSIELVGDVMPRETAARFITTFTTTSDNRLGSGNEIISYNSDAVEIKQPNFLQNENLDTVSFEIMFDSLEADVTVEFTKDTVISAAASWDKIETFAVVPSTTTVTKTYQYPTYNREYSWARIVYVRARNNTGKIDKAVVRL